MAKGILVSAEKSFSGKNKFILLLCSLGMLLVSAYLTYHFYEVKGSSALENGSICYINSYFNCGKAVDSDMSNIFGVPISVLGLLMGLFSLGLLVISRPGYRKTLSTLVSVNFVLCVGLFVYSVAVLQGLCPLCCLYYVFSVGLFVLLRLRHWSHGLEWRVLLGMAVIATLSAGLAWNQSQQMEEAKAQETQNSIAQKFAGLPMSALPTQSSGYKIVDNPRASIHLLVFSDFECPACKVFSQMLPKILERYQGKIDVEYYFFPLDSSCNPALTRPLHPFACQAAFVAACDPEHFAQIHDELFQNQEQFSEAWLNQFAKSHGLASCEKGQPVRTKVHDIIMAAGPVGLRSTPTLLLNGKKIAGVLPLDQLFQIMDSLAH